jgi:hypothetical protein
MHGEPRVFPECSQYCAHCIARTIVTDDQLIGHVTLDQNAFALLTQESPFTESAHGDRYASDA